MHRMLFCRIEMRHQIGASAERTDGQAAADDLAHHGQVWRDPGRRLRAAGSQPQRDHLVSNEQRAGATRRLGHARQEVRRRRDDSARAEDRFEEDRGDLAAVAREHRLERRRVAVFGKHRASALAGPFGLEVVV